MMRYCERGRKLSLRIRHGRAGFFGVTGCTVATRTDLPPLYLAVHHAVVVARWLSRIVGAICSLRNEEYGCTTSCRVQVPSPGILLEKGKIVYVKDMYSGVFVLISGFAVFLNTTNLAYKIGSPLLRYSPVSSLPFPLLS